MIDNSTTLITITKNKEDCIQYFLKKTNNYQRKHKNIKRIIIYDDQSTDNTIPLAIQTINQLKNHNIILLTNDKPRSERTKLSTIIKQINTPNTVFIEPELYTYLRNVTHQINLLKKSQIILPNRYHPASETIWSNHEPQQRRGLIQDPSNKNKAIKTSILKHLVEKAHLGCWQTSTIQEYKITQPPVDYNQHRNHAYEK